MRLVPLLLAGVALLGFLVGCGKQETGIGGQPAPKVFKRVVSLSPGSTEIAGVVFLREIIGRSESCDQPGHVKEAPVMMKGLKPDYEKIVALKPDCVLYDPDLFQQSDIDKFKELGIETFPLGKGDTVDEFIDMIYEFSMYTQAETLGSDYVDKIIRERATALAAAPSTPVSMAMLMTSNGAEHMIAGTEGFIADVIRSGGGKPVGPTGRLFMPLNAESFIAMDPDIIIVAGAPDGFLNDPRFKNMSAVKRKTVYGTNPAVALRRGAFVERFIKRVSELVQNFKR